MKGISVTSKNKRRSFNPTFDSYNSANSSTVRTKEAKTPKIQQFEMNISQIQATFDTQSFRTPKARDISPIQQAASFSNSTKPLNITVDVKSERPPKAIGSKSGNTTTQSKEQQKSNQQQEPQTCKSQKIGVTKNKKVSHITVTSVFKPQKSSSRQSMDSKTSKGQSSFGIPMQDIIKSNPFERNQTPKSILKNGNQPETPKSNTKFVRIKQQQIEEFKLESPQKSNEHILGLQAAQSPEKSHYNNHSGIQQYEISATQLTQQKSRSRSRQEKSSSPIRKQQTETIKDYQLADWVQEVKQGFQDNTPRNEVSTRLTPPYKLAYGNMLNVDNKQTLTQNQADQNSLVHIPLQYVNIDSNSNTPQNQSTQSFQQQSTKTQQIRNINGEIHNLQQKYQELYNAITQYKCSQHNDKPNKSKSVSPCNKSLKHSRNTSFATSAQAKSHAKSITPRRSLNISSYSKKKIGDLTPAKSPAARTPQQWPSTLRQEDDDFTRVSRKSSLTRSLTRSKCQVCTQTEQSPSPSRGDLSQSSPYRKLVLIEQMIQNEQPFNSFGHQNTLPSPPKKTNEPWFAKLTGKEKNQVILKQDGILVQLVHHYNPLQAKEFEILTDNANLQKVVEQQNRVNDQKDEQINQMVIRIRDLEYKVQSQNKEFSATKTKIQNEADTFYKEKTVLERANRNLQDQLAQHCDNEEQLRIRNFQISDDNHQQEIVIKQLKEVNLKVETENNFMEMEIQKHRISDEQVRQEVMRIRNLNSELEYRVVEYESQLQTALTQISLQNRDLDQSSRDIFTLRNGVEIFSSNQNQQITEIAQLQIQNKQLMNDKQALQNQVTHLFTLQNMKAAVASRPLELNTSYIPTHDKVLNNSPHNNAYTSQLLNMNIPQQQRLSNSFSRGNDGISTPRLTSNPLNNLEFNLKKSRALNKSPIGTSNSQYFSALNPELSQRSIDKRPLTKNDSSSVNQILNWPVQEQKRQSHIKQKQIHLNSFQQQNTSLDSTPAAGKSSYMKKHFRQLSTNATMNQLNLFNSLSQNLTDLQLRKADLELTLKEMGSHPKSMDEIQKRQELEVILEIVNSSIQTVRGKIKEFDQ